MLTKKIIAVCEQELRAKEKNLQDFMGNYSEMPLEELPKDPEELIQAADELRKARQNHQASKSMLEDVKIAIEKIESNAFGICDDCHEDIGDDRLMAMPWARRCRACQAQKGVKIS